MAVGSTRVPTNSGTDTPLFMVGFEGFPRNRMEGDGEFSLVVNLTKPLFQKRVCYVYGSVIPERCIEEAREWRLAGQLAAVPAGEGKVVKAVVVHEQQVKVKIFGECGIICLTPDTVESFLKHIACAAELNREHQQIRAVMSKKDESSSLGWEQLAAEYSDFSGDELLLQFPSM